MKNERARLLRRMERLAGCRVNDAVKLAFLDGEQLGEIDGLDLGALKEFKRSGNGAVELKLVDRAAVLERLVELSGGREDGAEALTWWCSAEGKSREAVICDGAVRSGKTLCMGLAFFLWATACFDGMAFGLCGKTITALRRNLLREVLPTLGALGFQWREQASQNRLTVRLGGKENTFYLFGGRDEGSAALIQGITLAGVLLDEAALMPRSFVEQACARCSVPGSRMWFSCNPEHPEHLFYN